MAKTTHATDWVSEPPTPAQMKEFYAQVQDKKITKATLQDFLRGKPRFPSLNQAMEIVGPNNFFGPKEWGVFFGDKFNLPNSPEIPWTRGELVSPGIEQEHFLFLGVDSLSEDPLNIVAWNDIYSGKKYPRFDQDWVINDKKGFMVKTCQLRWYFMPVGKVHGSTSLSFAKQEKMLPEDYEVPSAIERVTANILYYLRNGRYMDSGDYTVNVKDTYNDRSGVGIRGLDLPDRGLSLSYGYYVDWQRGVAASRKL